MLTNRLDGTTGITCLLWRGEHTELPCGKRAVICLIPHGTPICQRCLNEIMHDNPYLLHIPGVKAADMRLIPR